MLRLLLEDYINKYTAENINLKEVLTTLPKLRYDTGPWLCGGSLLRLMTNVKLSDGDLDFYFPHSDKRRRFIDKAKAETIQINVKSHVLDTKPIKTNIIHMGYYKSVKEIFYTFDFTICQLATDGYYIYCSEQTLSDIENRVLRLADEKINHAAIARYCKYIFRGFKPTKGGMHPWFIMHHEVISGDWTIPDYLIKYKQYIGQASS